MSSLNNLAITATNSVMTAAMGRLFDTLQSKLANWGRDSNCKFYYNNGAGGSILQVVAKGVVGGVVGPLKDEAVNQFNSLFDKKKLGGLDGEKWTSDTLAEQEKDAQQYGVFQTDEGAIYALDDWGCICTDALMLGIETDKSVTVRQEFPIFGNQFNMMGGQGNSSFQPGAQLKDYTFNTNTLVWYDTTAIITINSDKNIVATRVQGRDYSRKELVSNGDIKFSVSGQITFGKPDIYPSAEIKKFIQVMQYKGIVRINNQVLDQFGITHIVITDFSISSQEGYKAMQRYSFNAIGLQPENEFEITEDTITIQSPKEMQPKDDSSEWLKMLQNQLDGLKSMAKDAVSQGAALATGMLEDLL